MSKDVRIRAYLAYAAVCLFWGTTYLAIRIGVGVLPPALFAGLRFVTAGLLFATILLARGYALPRKHDWTTLAVVAIALLTIANGAVVWGSQFVPSSLAALIVTTLPLCMVAMEAVLPRGETLTLRKVGGITLGFIGIVILLWPDLRGSFAPDYLKGVLVILVAPLAWGAGSLYQKHRRIETHPLMAAAAQMVIAGTILTAVGAATGEFSRFSADLTGLAAMLYLVIFGSIVGYGSYIYALDKLPASMVSTYAYINPVVAVVLGWLVLDERLDGYVVVATAVILFGVFLVKTGGVSAAKPAAPGELTRQNSATPLVADEV